MTQFTEQQVRDLHGLPQDALVAFFQAHGLIAEEPVDPLLVEAREICARVCDGWTDIPARRARHYREGSHDDEADVAYALAALRRGMELAPRKELTREMVKDAMRKAELRGMAYEDDITRLHAALTEALQ